MGSPTDDGAGGCDDALADLLAAVADEYLARRAAGEEPDPEEFAARHPHAADDIRGALSVLRLARPGPLPPPPAPAGPPREIGDYRIVREVGRGGMGVVYEAEQVSLRRRVALKVLPVAAVTDARHLQRFRNEARAAASLDHPHVVKVFGVGEDGGVHYIAMQFVDGRTLADLVRERRGHSRPPAGGDATRTYAQDPTGDAPARAPSAAAATRPPLDPAFVRRVAEWGVQAAEGLEHAHGLGVVHRDVKPGNLLLDARGDVFVADFGLAKLAADPGVTGAGDVLGTLRYMSPEQAEAKHDLVDHRSDVYSLGATLYELLTLEPAFPGDSRAAILRAIADTDPAAPRQHDRAIPRDLETVVLKAMDKVPARRYQSAAELRDDLRRFLADEPVRARRPSVGDRAAAWARRNRAAVRAGAGAGVAVVAALAASLVLVLGAYDREAGYRKTAETTLEREREITRLQRKIDQQALEQAALIRKEYFPTDLARARTAWELGDTRHLRELLDRYKAGGVVPPPGFAWDYVDRLADLGGVDFVGHQFPLEHGDVSSHWLYVATADRAGVLKVWDAHTGRELWSVQKTIQEVSRVKFSPDGETVALCGQDQTVQVFEARTGAPVTRLWGHLRPIRGMCWAPDGKRLVTAGGSEKVARVWDVATGKARTLTGHTAWVVDVAWSPDGKRVVTAGNEDEPILRLWDTDTWEQVGVITGHRSLTRVAFSRSGALLAAGGYAADLLVHDLRDGRPPRRLDPSGIVRMIAFAADDRHVLVGLDNRVAVYDLADPNRSDPVRIIPFPGSVWTVSPTADGRGLLIASNEVKHARLVSLDRLRGYDRLYYGGNHCLGVMPDGRQIAFVSTWSDLITRRFTGGAGTNYFPLKFDGLDSRGTAISPAGDRIVTSQKEAAGWDVTARRPPRPLCLLDGADAPHALAYSPDGRLVAGAKKAGGEFSVWRADTGARVFRQAAEVVRGTCPVFSPKSSTLAVAVKDRVELWRVADWTRVTTTEPIAPPASSPAALAFSPDSAVLAGGGDLNGVTLWDARDGRRVGALAREVGGIQAVVFSPDGRALVTLGDDRTIRLWDVATLRELYVLYRHDAQLGWATFTNAPGDGGRLVVGARTNPVAEWVTEVLAFPPFY